MNFNKVSPYLQNCKNFIFIKRKFKDGKVAVIPKGDKHINHTFDYKTANKHIKEENNIGMVAGYGLIFVDCDSQELAEITRERLPATYEERTPSNGYHFIFECDEEVKNQEVKLNNKHLGEIRAKDEYIVIAPSVAKSKGDRNWYPYEVVNDCSPAKVTKEDLAKILQPFDKKTVAGSGKLSSDILTQIESDEELSKLFHGNTEGFASRSEAEQSLVGRLRSRGFDKKTVYAIMTQSKTDKWSEKPISYHELTWNKAQSFVTEPKQGWEDGKNITLNPLNIVSADEVVKRRTKVDWLINNLIENKSTVMTAGQTGSFKTTISIYKAVCISKGIPFLNVFKTKQKNVLLVLAETSESFNTRCLNAIKKGLRIRRLPNLWLLERKNCDDLLNETFKDRLSRTISEKNIGYLVLDTMNPLTPEIDDNVAKEVMKVFNKFLFPFVDYHGLTIEYLLHTDKKNKDFLGSIKWKANTDNMFYIDRDGLESSLTISNLKNRAGEYPNIQLKANLENDDKGNLKTTTFDLIKVEGYGRKAKNGMTKKDKVKVEAQKLLQNRTMTYTELLTVVKMNTKMSDGTCKTAIKELREGGIVKDVEGGLGL